MKGVLLLQNIISTLTFDFFLPNCTYPLIRRLSKLSIQKYKSIILYVKMYFSFKSPVHSVHVCSILKRYFIIDQQIAWLFVQYSEYLSNRPSLLCNFN